ncbi:ribonuclease MRP protein subunit POP4-like isoform X2 [Miscanthus floridulus]|uniref:ribonuclease MRP protein subunit POP4-like isoform X2 n=1 Tax=Miscanthus floridulus TaxID=154761 RepID=UPI00345A4338
MYETMIICQLSCWVSVKVCAMHLQTHWTVCHTFKPTAHLLSFFLCGSAASPPTRLPPHARTNAASCVRPTPPHPAKAPTLAPQSPTLLPLTTATPAAGPSLRRSGDAGRHDKQQRHQAAGGGGLGPGDLGQPAPQLGSSIWYWLPKGSMSTISDQKKRTLEALQQQYTAAKAKKLQDEQVKSQKKSNFNTPKPKLDAPRKGKAPEITPHQTYAQPSPHKGVAFSSSNRQQKPSASSGNLPTSLSMCAHGSSVWLCTCATNTLNFVGEEINPVYAELSSAFHDNLSKDGVSDLDGTEVVHSVIYDIIQKGGDAGKITKGAKKLKLEKGILLDNYVQRGPRLVDAQARSLLIHSKRSKRHMSLKQHKKCGSFDLDGTFHKYDFYKPMHEMWKDYIRGLMKVTPKKKLSENLLSADLHGALLIECKAASYQGVNGIMIRDTAETFGIISEDNRFRVVPKAGSVFILQADCWKVTLIGDKLSPREKLKEDQRQHRGQSQIR